MESMQKIYHYIFRECLLYYRKRADLLNPLLFFVIIASLFPLAISTNPKMIAVIGPGVVWVAALLAILLSLPQLFYEDYADGSLEQLLQSPYPIAVLLFAKITAHWIVFCLPLILLSPLLAIFYNLNVREIDALVISLLIGTPFLTFVGAVGSGLTVGLRNGGMLLALLIIPLYIPALIFGASVAPMVNAGHSVAWIYAMLGVLFTLSILFAPITTAATLRIAVNYDQ